MNKLEEYIEKIYRNFDEKDEETKILKEEMKAHLFEEAEELRNHGLTEQESINKVIANFGTEKAVICEMQLILKRQNKFSKALIRVALIIVIVASIFKFFEIGDDFLHRNENSLTNDKRTSLYIINNIISKVENKDLLDVNLKNEVTVLLDEFNNKNNNGLYYLKLEKEDNLNIEYEYKRDVSEDMIKDGHGSENMSNKWKVYFNRTDNQANYDSENVQAVMNKIVSRLPYKLGLLSNYLFVISGVLLCVYFLNKIYVKNSFSKSF
ncbi:MAG: hypothetical protein H7Y18_06765 [Clostridiaceae bacterium]|nr:hypothetical protein [Clostridiaceae bacterium]